MILQPATSTMVLLASLLASQMNLPVTPNGRIFLYNQKWNIPPGDGLFISVNFTGEKVFGSDLTYANNPVTDVLEETKTVNTRETYTINLFSRNVEAITRKHEVTFAFHSTAAQQLCETNSMQIAPVPSSVVDTSSIEASAELNRTSITITVLRAYSQTNNAQFFDTFNTAALLTNA